MTWSRAVVIGASGGIGSALAAELDKRGCTVLGLSRSGSQDRHIDIENEQSIARAAERVAADGAADLVIVASGALSVGGKGPEKSWAALEADYLARLFAVNATGPALVAKHFLPLLPRHGRSAFAVLGARVGSIGDNRLGGWYGYRASKAALVQLVRTLAVELARSRPEALCVTLHPGTVATSLSERFAAGRETFSPEEAAHHLLAVLDRLTPASSGRHFAWDGAEIAP